MIFCWSHEITPKRMTVETWPSALLEVLWKEEFRASHEWWCSQDWWPLTEWPLVFVIFGMLFIADLYSRIPMNTTVDQDPSWLIATQQLGAQLAGLPCSRRMLRKGLSVQRVPSWFCGQWSPTMPTWGHEVPRCHPVFVEPLWIFVDGGYQHAKSLMWVDVGWWLLPLVN